MKWTAFSLIVVAISLGGLGCSDDGSESPTPVPDATTLDVGDSGAPPDSGRDGGEDATPADASPDMDDTSTPDVGDDQGLSDTSEDTATPDTTDQPDTSTSDVGPPPSADLFAAPDGSGDQCSHDAPCSLATAQGRIRSMVGAMQRDLVVLLRGGRYALAETMTLGPSDSGQNGHFVVYQAYPGEEPVVSGGLSVSGWTMHDAGRNIYRAAAPAGLRTRQLFIDGRRARRARSQLDPAGYSVVVDGYQGPASLDTWGNKTDIELVDTMQWKAFRCAVQSISGGHIVMKQPCWSLAQWHTNLGMEAPTWIENAYELLDSPGEWYHDRSANQIYAIPRRGQNLATARTIVASLQTLVRLEGAHHLQLRGLSFEHSTWLRPGEDAGYPVLQAGQLLSGDLAIQPNLESTPAAVVVRDSTDLIFEANRFQRLGAAGLSLEGGSKRAQIGGNLFRDVSASAIVIGNVRGANAADNQTASDHNILNNVIDRVGVEYLDSPGILLTYAARCTIRHNELHDLPYTGISMGWGWGMQASVLADNVIEHNRIGNAMLRLNDGGLIYTLNTQPGARIADNLLFGQVHDYGGIYLDQGSQHFEIVGNVVASTPRWYFLQPEVPPRAQGNTVTGNFADTGDVGCCGSQGCCTDVNTVSDNSSFTATGIPGGVRQIALATGIDPVYADMRPASQRYEAEAYRHGSNGNAFNEIPSFLGDESDYRGDRVDVEACEACSNDHRVGDIADGEWLAYYVFAPTAGAYDVAVSVTGSSGGTVGVRIDGQAVGNVAIGSHGAGEIVEAGMVEGVVLEAGLHHVRMDLTGDFGFDFFELRRR